MSSCSRVKLGGAVQLSWCSKMMSDVKPNLCASVSMFGSWRIISASYSVQLGDMCAFLVTGSPFNSRVLVLGFRWN